MYVKLVSITKPCLDDPAIRSAEDLIVYCARVSNPDPAAQANMETAPRLLGYLVRNKHWSPFEAVSMTLEVETSRAVAAQILRHRSFTFQEFSQRYSAATMGFENTQPRRQDTKNRQNSIPDLDEQTQAWWGFTQQRIQAECQEAYETALFKGVAKECARMLLPLSTTTRLYMSGPARSWIHYFQVRLDPSTQKEHRDVAWACKEIFKQHFPHTCEALGL